MTDGVAFRALKRRAPPPAAWLAALAAAAIRPLGRLGRPQEDGV
jgi:hypothetical protein